MASFILVLGVYWLTNVRTIPDFDASVILECAINSIKGDFSQWENPGFYLKKFPFQLGYLFFEECVLRIVGIENNQVFEYINLVMVISTFIGIVFMVKRITCNQKVVFMTILFSMLCVQPILFSTFEYGNIIGMACSVWGMYFFISFLQDRKWMEIFFTVLLVAIGVVIKKNIMLMEFTILIIAFLDLLENKSKKNVVLMITMVLAISGMNTGIRQMYENRAGETLGEGTPLTTHLAMGMQESDMAPGWFNNYTFAVQEENEYDYGKVKEQNIEDIKDRAKIFIKDPRYAITFYTKKLFSQWDEPTFQSIYVSQVLKHKGEIPRTIDNIYNGTMGKGIYQYMKHQVQILYVLALMGIWQSRRNRNLRILTPLLYLLGAFIYYLLFEGKSQYILIYLPVIIPYAALGIESVETKSGLLARIIDVWYNFRRQMCKK